MMKWLLLLLTIVLTAAANIVLKYSAANRQTEVKGITANIWEMLTNVPLIVGISCLGLAVIPYSIALRSINLSVAYPVMTTSVVVLVSTFSAILFGEPVTLVKTIGVVIVISGVILLSQS